MTEDKINQPEKRKFALWISRDTIELAKQHYKDDNCSSASEFIEKAILFYLGYVSSQQNQDYLARVIPRHGKGHRGRELQPHGAAAVQDGGGAGGDREHPRRCVRGGPARAETIAGQCVEEIKRTNGMISFEQALQWQKE